MQIVHYIPHPRYKITVFRSGNRYVVKFDDADHDLAFKFREGEVNNLQDIELWVDQQLLRRVQNIFDNLAQFRVERFKGLSMDYPDII